MAQSYTYTIFAKDAASAALFKLAGNSQTAFAKMRTNQNQWQKNNDRLGNSINGLRAKLQGFEQKRDQSFSAKRVAMFNRGIRQTQKELTRLENMPKPSFLARLKGISSSMGGILPIAGGVGLALGAWNGVTGVLKLGADMEQTRVSFTTMLGSADKANSMIAQLNKFANKTPFSNSDLQKNANLLLSFGINGNKVLPTLKMIGDVSGGNKEKLNSLSLAYAQVSSAGKLTGQDLMQMVNAGFNPLQTISEKTGRSMASLKEDMSKGAISAKDVEQAFADATGKGGRFYEMMIKQSETASGKYSTFMGLLTGVGISIGQKLLPAAKRFLDWGIKAVEWLSVAPTYFDALTQSIHDNRWTLGLLGVAVLALSANFIIAKTTTFAYAMATKASILWTKVATAGQWLFNAALTANPIGLVIAGIAALAAGVVYAYNKVGWFRGGIMAAWETVKGFGGIIKEFVIDRIKSMIQGITGIGETLMLFFKGDWQAAWETGKKAASDLVGLDAAKNAVGKLKGVGMDAVAAYSKGVDEAKANKKTGFAESLLSGKDSSPGLLGAGAPEVALTGGGAAGNIDKGVDTINGGGKKQTNINVTFDKLIEQLTIKSQTMEMGIDDMEAQVSAAVLRVLNSFTQLKPA